MAFTNPLALSRPTFVEPQVTGFAYPSTAEDWQMRQNWLWSAYSNEGYSQGDITLLGLFRALDENGKTIAETRRLTRDHQFVVDTDVGALAGPVLSLEARGGAPKARVAQGQRVWGRSNLNERISKEARDAAAMGDTYLEAIRTEDGSTRIVGYDPRHVIADYSEDGTELIRVTVRIPFFEGAPTDSQGMDLGRALQIYQRVVDKDRITVTIADPNQKQGELLRSQSGPHGLGVVPVVHIPFIQWGEPEHGLWAGHAMEPYIAQVDSSITQMRAISNRYANPILAVFGGKIPSGSDISKFGRTLSGLAPDARAEYLETGLEAIRNIWDATQAYVELVRPTIPEFLFSGAGANTSGRALDMWASNFRMKMSEVRSVFYGSLARVTQYAALMDEGAAFDPDDQWYRIAAPPILPIDVNARVQHVSIARGLKVMTKATAVRHLQAVGLVDEERDVDAYLQELAEESEAATPAQFAGFTGGPASEDEGPNDEKSDEDDADGEA